jgi:TetR/AcrR family transcriptional regulator, tetracycline repressor protein
LLSERGLNGLSLRAVAARLGASPGTLYNYFDNKQALLEAMLARPLRDIDRTHTGTAGWQSALRTVMISLHAAFSAYPAAVTLLNAGIGAQRMDHIRERLLGLLAEGGLATPDRIRAQNMLVSLAVGDVIVHSAHTVEHRAAELARRRALSSALFPFLTEASKANLEEPGSETFLAGLDALIEAVAAMPNNR